MNAVVQEELLLTSRPKKSELGIGTILKQPNFLAAINLCISESGLEDKELYLALEIDSGHWSCIRKGTKHFPTNKIEALMDLCGNEIPLMWLAQRRGYECKPVLSTLEQQLEAEQARSAELERGNRLMRELLRR